MQKCSVCESYSCICAEKKIDKRTFLLIGLVTMLALLGIAGILSMLFVFLQNEQQSPVVQPETRQPVDYEHALLLQIDKVLLLLQTVRKDLRAFLKEVNATDKPKEVIDVFRSQLESHAGQLRQCEETLSLLKPPQEATSELHSKLLVGLIKYRRAVETYAEGLAAYDFNVVKQSQLELEQADSEIHLAVERITSNFAK